MLAGLQGIYFGIQSSPLVLAVALQPRFFQTWVQDQGDRSHRMVEAVAVRVQGSRSQAERLMQVGWQRYQSRLWGEALELFRQGLQLWQHVQDDAGIGNALSALSLTLWQLQEWDAAINVSKQALHMAEQLGDVATLGRRLTRLGTMYRQRHQLETALGYYCKAVTMFQKTSDDISLGRSLNNLGVLYSQLGQVDRATHYCRSAAEILDGRDQDGESAAWQNAGMACFKAENYAQAVLYFEKALVIRVALGDFAGEAMTFSYLGKSYQQLGEANYGFTCYQEALSLRQAMGDRIGSALVLSDIAATYQQAGAYRVVVDYYQQALQLFEAAGDAKSVGIVLYNLGNAYEQQGQFSQALSCYQEAMAQWKACGFRLPGVVTPRQLEACVRRSQAQSITIMSLSFD